MKVRMRARPQYRRTVWLGQSGKAIARYREQKKKVWNYRFSYRPRWVLLQTSSVQAPIFTIFFSLLKRVWRPLWSGQSAYRLEVLFWFFCLVNSVRWTVFTLSHSLQIHTISGLSFCDFSWFRKKKKLHHHDHLLFTAATSAGLSEALGERIVIYFQFGDLVGEGRKRLAGVF